MSEFFVGFQDTWNYTLTLMPSLLKGVMGTIQIFVWTLVFALPLGLPFALGSISRFRVIRSICKIYIWIFRGTPLILQLYFFYYCLSISFNITLTVFTTAIVTFVLNYAAYFAEIYRGGINSIDHGQYEAAHSLGLSKRQTMFGIILPQTMKAILPPVSNEVITLVKDTALVSVLGGISELMKVSRSAVNRDANTMAYLLAALIYLVFTFLLTLLSKYMEQRFSKYDTKEEW